MRVLTFIDCDLGSKFDKVKENIINDTSTKDILIDNHTTQTNKGKISGQLQ